MKGIDSPNVIVIFPVNRAGTVLRGEMIGVAKHAHVHLSNGECFKNRYAQRCSKWPKKSRS